MESAKMPDATAGRNIFQCLASGFRDCQRKIKKSANPLSTMRLWKQYFFKYENFFKGLRKYCCIYIQVSKLCELNLMFRLTVI